ncbi:hypothetical protein Syun_009028 [Stephania yunnanensis]|uniref:Uncharacterized protein n=1 Tax=Stephania yunnanensis TaxID=152371 RepID=A0AAP0KFT7_9MAGN
MGKHSCVVSSSSDDSKFSSPIPLVGTYAAGISLVCLLLITLDKCAAFRNGKRWLPCRFFPLNSLTLTLVGIATILPVDLTTLMPNAQDQLSKLTGSLHLHLLGFLMPSLDHFGIPSVNRESRAAKAMWTGETFNAIFQETKSQVVNAIQMPQEQAIEIIKSVKGNLSNFGYYSISQELNMIIRFIKQRANRSMEEIHRDLEQLFVDMLNERLVQTPGIIVKEINESPPEELEKRLKEAI